jgi:hypothetical protein
MRPRPSLSSYRWRTGIQHRPLRLDRVARQSRRGAAPARSTGATRQAKLVHHPAFSPAGARSRPPVEPCTPTRSRLEDLAARDYRSSNRESVTDPAGVGLSRAVRKGRSPHGLGARVRFGPVMKLSGDIEMLTSTTPVSSLLLSVARGSTWSPLDWALPCLSKSETAPRCRPGGHLHPP